MKFFKRKNIFNSPEYLEVDEILFDKHQLSQSEIKWKHKIEHAIPKRNLYFLGGIVFVFLALVALRSGYFSLFRNKYFLAKAESNYIKEIWEFSPRGIIYDAKLKPLVENQSVFNLVAIPAELPRARAIQEKIIQNLAQILNKDEYEIKSIFEDIDRFSFRPVPILEDLNHDELLVIKSKLEDLPGFRLEHNFKRNYASGSVYSHVLGYTGKVSSADVKGETEYLLTDSVGKDGLEYQYGKFLRGEHGVTLMEAKAQGETRDIISSKPAQSGDNLILFLDAELQQKLTEAMSGMLSSIGQTKAAAVAVDPKSGGILALQSFPLFDSNAFGGRLSQESYDKIFGDKNQPLFNRAIAGLYPPGSTIKPFLGVGALQEGLVDDKTVISDMGSITVGDQIFRGWTILGPVDIYKAIALSSNIFFYTVGGGYGHIKGLGVEKIGEYLKKFGFAALTNIDLPGEQAGLMPDPKWKRLVKKESWFAGDTYNIAIGQGDIQATPLQLAMATAAIANNGVLLKPRLVKSITNAAGQPVLNIEPEIVKKDFVDFKSLSIIREAMHQTIIDGSGRVLAGLLGSAGGKTGTAQTGLGNNTHAWFTVFAPYDNPRIVLTVMVENGGEGSSVAVPIARDVLEWYLNR